MQSCAIVFSCHSILIDRLTSFYAEFVGFFFSILGFIAKDVGLTVEEISILASDMYKKNMSAVSFQEKKINMY